MIDLPDVDIGLTVREMEEKLVRLNVVKNRSQKNHDDIGTWVKPLPKDHFDKDLFEI